MAKGKKQGRYAIAGHNLAAAWFHVVRLLFSSLLLASLHSFPSNANPSATELQRVIISELKSTHPSCADYRKMTSSDRAWCADRAAVVMDNALNEIYVEVWNKFKKRTEDLSKIKKAQRSWIKYRDALCVVNSDSGQLFTNNECVLETIALSIYYLNKLNAIEGNHEKNEIDTTTEAYLAATSLKKLSASKPTLLKAPEFERPDVKQHALIIASEDYDHLPDLKTPGNDAKEIARILENKFGFKTSVLLNPERADITKTLNALVKRLSPDDDLLIYYAGHGIEVEGDGYWVPKDGQPEDDTNWIANDYITKKLKNIKATNVLLISDSCFSGTLSRGITFETEDVNGAIADNRLQKLQDTKSRIVITSGNLEPVLDGGGGQHSVFARAFIETLIAADEANTATEIYSLLSKVVVEESSSLGAQQVPTIAALNRAGHLGPDFIFFPK